MIKSRQGKSAPSRFILRTIFPVVGLSALLLTGCESGGTAGPDGSFTLTLSAATVNLTPGASGSVTVTISRSDDFTGGVTITVEGLPAGVTAGALTIAPGSTSGLLTLTGALSAGVGATNLTVRGSGSGVADKTASLQLTVIAPGTGNTTVAFCPATGIPLWVAYKDGDGAWTRAMGGPNTYSFQVNANTAGAAWVLEDGAGGFNLFVLLGTRDEVNTIGGTRCAGVSGAGKMITGTLQGVPLGAFGTVVSLGGRTATLAPPNPPVAGVLNASFTGVRDGPVDLVAGASQIVGAAAIVPVRMFLRRNLNPAAGSAINDIDLAGPESFAPQVSALTVNNVGVGEQVIQTTQLNTANGSALVGNVLGPTATTSWYGVPQGKLVVGDVHLLSVLATNPLVQFAPTRQVLRIVGAPEALILNLGPNLTQPNVVGIAATGYARARAEYAIQAEYNRTWMAAFQQTPGGNTRQTQIQMTQGFFGSGTGTVTLEIPDFSGVAGWLAIWGLRAGIATTWTVTSSGWTSQGGVTQPALVDGNVAFMATRQGQFTP